MQGAERSRSTACTRAAFLFCSGAGDRGPGTGDQGPGDRDRGPGIGGREAFPISTFCCFTLLRETLRRSGILLFCGLVTVDLTEKCKTLNVECKSVQWWHWALGTGLWALGSGLWALGSGHWALGTGLWVLGSGCWALGPGFLAIINCRVALTCGPHAPGPWKCGEGPSPA